jgi:hypothetical protein
MQTAQREPSLNEVHKPVPFIQLGLRDFPWQIENVFISDTAAPCQLDYLGHGNVGVAYLLSAKTKSEPTVVKLGFSNQSGLFAAEKKLLVDFSKSHDTGLASIKKYMVPTTAITIMVAGKRGQALQKQWVRGQHLDEALRIKSAALEAALMQFYADLKNSYQQGYVIADLHERNIIWSPVEEKLTIIDGAGGHQSITYGGDDVCQRFEGLAAQWDWPEKIGLIRVQRAQLTDLFTSRV